MFNFSLLQKIEIEITNRCQAKCPMCSRNFHGGVKNQLFQNAEWTIDDFKKILTKEVLKQINHLTLCGGLGDPLMVKDLAKMLKYVKNCNPHIFLSIHTNGSLRSESFWKDLPSCLPKNHLVYFAIDGFSDTHSLYRINTDWNKIIRNSKAFINSHGCAEANFIQFKHNQHQFEDLKRYLTKEIGFRNVNKNITERFRSSPSFPVLDSNEGTDYFLEACDENVDIPTDKELDEHLENAQQKENNLQKCCESIDRKQIFIDAQRKIFPCCYTATIRYQLPIIGEESLNKRFPRIKQEINSIMKELDKENLLDLEKNSIKEIINDDNYFQIWKKYWIKQKLLLCDIICGVY